LVCIFSNYHVNQSIGSGWGVKIQVPAFRKAGLNVSAVWCRNEEKAKKIAEEYKIPFGNSIYGAPSDIYKPVLISKM
jgi:hypothetical protein